MDPLTTIKSTRAVWMICAFGSLFSAFGQRMPRPVVASGAQGAAHIRHAACDRAVKDRVAAVLPVLCDEVLPGDGRIWTETDAGVACWCQCPNVDGVTIGRMDSLRSALSLRETSRIMGRAKRWLDSDTMHHGCQPKSGFAHRNALPPGVVTGSAPMLDRYSMIVDLMSEFEEEYPVFNWYIDSLDSYPAPYSFEHDGPRLWDHSSGPMDPDDRMMIVLPMGFVSNGFVGRQLIAMMVAHEIGHALGPITSCNGTSELVCEGDCDHYGASVVLRRVFPGPGYVMLSRRAESQFGSFARDVLDCLKGYAIFSDCTATGCHCGYPPVDCRARTMRAARQAMPKPPCVDGWYEGPPSDCLGAGDCPY